MSVLNGATSAAAGALLLDVVLLARFLHRWNGRLFDIHWGALAVGELFRLALTFGIGVLIAAANPSIPYWVLALIGAAVPLLVERLAGNYVVRREIPDPDPAPAPAPEGRTLVRPEGPDNHLKPLPF